MTREEFLALPASVALALLWDHCPDIARVLASATAPQVPRAPRYDARIYRKDGYQWASEMDLGSLVYWKSKYSSSTNEKYAEKDAKRARELEYWIAWRRVDPTSRWTGKRNDEEVTADAPRPKPFIYAREQRRDDSTYEQPPAATEDFDSSESPF